LALQPTLQLIQDCIEIGFCPTAFERHAIGGIVPRPVSDRLRASTVINCAVVVQAINVIVLKSVDVPKSPIEEFQIVCMTVVGGSEKRIANRFPNGNLTGQRSLQRIGHISIWCSHLTGSWKISKVCGTLVRKGEIGPKFPDRVLPYRHRREYNDTDDPSLIAAHHRRKQRRNFSPP